MATAAGAKKFALFAGTVATTMTATDLWINKGQLPPITVVAGGFLATGILLALSDAAPNLGGSLAALVLLSSILANARLFQTVGKKIGG